MLYYYKPTLHSGRSHPQFYQLHLKARAEGMAPQSPQRFGFLLTKAVRIVAMEKHKNIGIVEDELGYAIGRESGGSSIRYWRKGHIPPEPDEVEKLARWLVKHKGLTAPQELKDFLDSAGHPTTVQLCAQLFPPDPQKPANPPDPSYPKIAWGDAPDVNHFYGREDELAQLTTWLTTDRCKLVGIFGMGGIGKTALAARLVEGVKDHFDYIIWRSLRFAPPLAEVLAEIIDFLAGEPQVSPPERLDQHLARLMPLLENRCSLLILDNLEAILTEEERVGHFRPGYEGYGELIRCLGEGRHQSCLLLTSREKPKTLAQLSGVGQAVRSFQLAGLGEEAGQRLLQDQRLLGKAQYGPALIRRYSGHPLALKLVSETILEVFAGHIAHFLAEEVSIFGDIRDVLDQQFARLSRLEQEIMFWLAIEQEVVTPAALAQNFLGPVTKPRLLEALQALCQRFLVEKSLAGFSLQNVILEYMTHRLIRQVCHELLSRQFELFNRHALSKAQAKTYIRQSQGRLILSPLVGRLLRTLEHEDALANLLLESLPLLRHAPAVETGYAAGNILNLLIHLKVDLSGRDFSRLPVRQANLQNIALQNVNFAQADLRGSVFREAFESVWGLAFSPDSQFLVGGLENGEIRLWRVRTGQQLLTCLEHDGYVWSIVFSPDGRWLASHGNDGAVRLWDARTWQCRRRLYGHTHRGREVAFSPDGRWLASAGEDHTIRLWDVAAGQNLAVLVGHTDQVWSVAFHPDGRHLASSSIDQSVRLWDLQTGQTLKRLQGQTNWLKSIAFSPDGRYLAGGCEDKNVYLWTLADPHQPQILSGHTSYVRKVAFSPDGSLLASGSEDGAVRLWDARSGKCLKILSSHAGRVWQVAFSRDSRLLASSGDDKTMRLWDTQTYRPLKTWRSYANRTLSVAFSPDGQTLASGHGDAMVQLWDVRTKSPGQTLRGHTDRIWSVAFSPDGRLLTSGSYDKTIKVWDVKSGQCLHTLSGHTDWVRQLVFSPDGCLLISSSDDKTVRFWHLESGDCLKILRGHTGWVWTAALSPDGRLLATGSADQTVRLWRVETGECLQTFAEHSGQVWSVTFSPDGRLLASAGQDQTIKLWDLQTNFCLKTFSEHGSRVWCVRFTMDGQTLVSGGEDYKCYLWDLQTGRPRQVLSGHTDLVISVAPHPDPDGQILATASLDVTIKLWDLVSGACLATLRPARPYEQMNIAGATGLTEAQKASLKALGAVETY